MGIRGQNSEAWLSRWRQGDCPVHGVGLSADHVHTPAAPAAPAAAADANVDSDDEDGNGDDASEDADGGDHEDGDGDDGADHSVAVGCPREGCTVLACQWPGKDGSHSFFGWLAGPDEIRAALAHGGDIATEGPRPGHHARSVRTAWPLPGEETRRR